MRLIYHNDWDLYALTESNENASYPAENTQDIRLAKTWRTSTASAATIYMDAGTGSTVTCDCAAIVSHNLSSAATVAVQAATASAFAPVALSANVTYRSGIMVVYFTSGAYRYWRFNISDIGNSDGYYEIGRLYIGTYLQVDPSSLVEWPERHERTDRVMFSRSNQLYADQGVEYKTVNYRFEYAANSAKTSIETMWGSVGMYKPLLLMNYDTSFSVVEPLYCSIIDSIEFKHLQHDEWNFGLSLRECD